MAKIKQILTNYKFFFFTILCFVIISILVFDYLKKNTKQLLTEIKSLKVENTVSNRQIAKIEKIFQGKKYFERDIISRKSTKYNLSKYYLGQLVKGKKKALISNRWSYFDRKDNNIFLMSASGQSFYFNISDFDKNDLNIIKIENNLNNTFKLNNSLPRFSVKDILISDDNNIYVSVLNLEKENCHNIVIYKSPIDTNNLNFEEFFSFDECLPLQDGGISPSSQNGGRIVDYKDNKLLFSVGDFSVYELAQDDKSFFGKIYTIDKDNPKNYKRVSIGHRNPQGLFYDKEKDLIFSTEHGPKGGDEFNLIKEGKNYGWPTASYGELGDETIKLRAPNIIKLLKSHNKYGFEEPIKEFTPSIGISELISNYYNMSNNESYFITSMKNSDEGYSIYQIDFDSNNKVINEDKIYLGDRIRDILYLDEKGVYLVMLESSYALGLLKKIN
jgi:hypothetical protein|tara:strand:+ start:874 stop:2205 length:1332 start_codon:yes stop_codon:yes gene_type:complete